MDDDSPQTDAPEDGAISIDKAAEYARSQRGIMRDPWEPPPVGVRVDGLEYRVRSLETSRAAERRERERRDQAALLFIWGMLLGVLIASSRRETEAK